ncbi:MAG: gliding motility-associated ABC transporter ATP-binding subunit GldA [Bacteroidales bacterium]|nr:gliding motility-associated ABC transporter ATP-binding subunit GldA [Bacteroidales bacterium]
MSINVDHITKLYGTQKALDAISLEINPGEVVGLLGPNGAGKSTLMKILTCYIPPTSGDASVCGFDVLEQSMEVRKRVGYLPENNPLYLDLYVKEFLHFIAEINHDERTTGQADKRTSGQVKRRIAEIIELTGLQEEQHKKIGALSRGFRQRVGLAQALLHDPEVLILDEPTSGLDPNQLVEIRSLIQSIGKEKTIMMSTHIMQEVEAICDRTIIIHKGKIVADDKTRNLRKIETTKIIVKVEFDKPVDPKKLLKINGITEVLPPPSGIRHPDSTIWHLASDSTTDIRPSVFKFAVDNGLTVLSMQRDEQRLEEVFQELTRT